MGAKMNGLVGEVSAPQMVHRPIYRYGPDWPYRCAMDGTPTDDDAPIGRHPEGMEWARYVRRATQQPGLNVSRLAHRAGVGRTSVQRWMRNDGTRVTIEKARAIAEAIGDDPASALQAAGALIVSGAEDVPLNVDLHGLDPRDEIVREILAGPWGDDMRDRMLKAEVLRRQQRLGEIQMTAEAYRQGDDRENGDGVDKAA